MNSLRLEFTFNTTGSSTTTERRGGGVSWAEIQHPNPQPATPADDPARLLPVHQHPGQRVRDHGSDRGVLEPPELPDAGHLPLRRRRQLEHPDHPCRYGLLPHR
jgi:hypothetical protein